MRNCFLYFNFNLIYELAQSYKDLYDLWVLWQPVKTALVVLQNLLGRADIVVNPHIVNESGKGSPSFF